VLETAIEEKKKREELKAKRNLLFDRYLKHPMDTRLALEIKIIDDQLAEERKVPSKRSGS
jgi:capsid portal protein